MSTAEPPKVCAIDGLANALSATGLLTGQSDSAVLAEGEVEIARLSLVEQPAQIGVCLESGEMFGFMAKTEPTQDFIKNSWFGFGFASVPQEHTQVAGGGR